jgi:uncharacterized ferredoxin-like protein
MKTSPDLETAAALHVATLMAGAARTAPKTRGIDNIKMVVVDDAPAKQRLVATMRDIGTKESRPSLVRDAGNIEASPALVVIGVEANPAGLNCGFCGQPTCEALEAAGGICAFNSIDLGIAICSAAATASRFHVDNRVMFSIGRACRELRLFGESVRQILGIPLSVTGKSPFFDRKA